MRIDQFVPAFHRGDAIGDEAWHLRNFFRSRRFNSDIYRLTCDRDLEEESRPFLSFPAQEPGDIAILHFALPSPLTQGLIESRGKRVIIHHNITAPEFFAGFSEEMVNLAQAGRAELATLAPHVDLALADSEFNCQELRGLGFKKPEVFPLYIDFAKYEKPASRFVRSLFADDRTNILFVGRVVPNKKIEDLIRVVFYYKKYISPLVRLIIVGKTGSLPKYYESLVCMADEFYLKPEEIVFTGHLPDEEMYAVYRACHVFLSMSEHEGFCLPLIESMIFDLPVVAFNSTAVPGTLDGAGVLINTKRVDLAAELVARVAHDADIREAVIDGQRRRLERFKKEGREEFLLRLLESLG